MPAREPGRCAAGPASAERHRLFAGQVLVAGVPQAQRYCPTAFPLVVRDTGFCDYEFWLREGEGREERKPFW